MKSEVIKTISIELTETEAVAIMAMVEDGVAKRKGEKDINVNKDRFITVSRDFCNRVNDFAFSKNR